MRRIVSILLAVMFCVACFTGCGSSKDNGGTAAVDVRNAKSIADLAGAKIAAQTGTFHADALEHIPTVQASTYPEFSDLLTALKSGAIDGYVAEEPTAFSVCASNDDLTYLPFKNNDTGFTATAADVGIAIGLKKGNTLRDQINTVLAEITDEQRSELMEQIVTLSEQVSVERTRLTGQQRALDSVKRSLTTQRTRLQKDSQAARANIKQLSKKEKAALQQKIAREQRLDVAIDELRKLTRGNKEGNTFTAKTSNLRLPVVGGGVKRYKGNMAEIAGPKGAQVISIYEGKVVELKRYRIT